ncbi:aminoacetone oxidase family FAD-binding enzyme [Peptoanaerobacter stomatis]|uniref:aminoacetone oxidase family FAD-binding enzyme n=1 Tax=Peptoanaerobacter stomatis TaxID=796937 RepID=UPI002E8E13CD|nr:aminoacetone oxidase family FAD-binding enzyme [Peptoanaerobacter stomatis]
MSQIWTAKKIFFAKIPENSKFFYSAFAKFSNYDFIDYLENIGIPLKYEGQKAYPKNESAQKTVNTFIKLLEEKNVEIRLNEELIDFEIDNESNTVTSITTTKTKEHIDKLIITTGGLSYCKNNTFSLLAKKGIQITQLYPSLVSIETIYDYSNLSGISIKNVSVRANIDGKKYLTSGDMLFTQKGLSGPAIIDMSSYIVKFQDLKTDTSSNHKNLTYKGKNLEISIDFMPDISKNQLEDIIFDSSKKALKTKLSAYLPERMLKFLFEKYEDKDINNIKKEEKEKLLNILKNYKIAIKNFSNIKSAIVTKGGVSLNQISPSTIQFKNIQNLYFAGECLDIDALTGGYNLQIAFSTVYLAGNNAKL